MRTENSTQLPVKRRSWRTWLPIGVVVVVVVAGMAAPFLLRTYTDAHYDAEHYGVDALPDNYEVAIVFGARVLRDGRLSTMLRDRVATGIDLYMAGKVDYLLMTGDGSSEGYNEPRAMRAYAVSRGVPENAIILDEAGLRTYDSCFRARDVFGLEQAVLVTQDFHLDRALFLCDNLGLEVVGVAADYQRPNGYSAQSLRWQNLREVAATFVAAFDLLTGTTPAVLEDPRPILP